MAHCAIIHFMHVILQNSRSLQKHRWPSNLNLRGIQQGRGVADAEQEAFISSNGRPEEGHRPAVQTSRQGDSGIGDAWILYIEIDVASNFPSLGETDVAIHNQSLNLCVFVRSQGAYGGVGVDSVHVGEGKFPRNGKVHDPLGMQGVIVQIAVPVL